MLVTQTTTAFFSDLAEALGGHVPWDDGQPMPKFSIRHTNLALK